MGSLVVIGRASLLSVEHIYKSYTKNGDNPILTDFSLDLAPGELVGILGPSGCGKSTLLRILASLESFDDGMLRFAGEINPPPSPERMLTLPDEAQLFPWLTAAGNIRFALRASGQPARSEDADRLLTLVHLRECADRFPHTLSSGMRQRVVLARALATRPKLLFMDEPFARLDAQTRIRLQDLVRELWRDHGVTIVFVSHDILEVVRVAERIIVLGSDGSIRSDEPNTLDEPRSVANPALAKEYARLEATLDPPVSSQPSFGVLSGR